MTTEDLTANPSLLKWPVLTRPSLVQFARPLTRQLEGDKLDDWLRRAWDKAVLCELRRFATGLKSDYDAVKAALTTRWNNAQLEGQVNRLKLIKRQMYGRAQLDLLRQRVLHMA